MFENHAKTQHHHVDTELEDGEIREHHVFSVSPKVDDSLKEYHIHHGNLKIGAHVGTRSKLDESSENYFIHNGNLKIRADVGVTVMVDEKPNKEDVSEDRESEKYVTNVILKMNEEGNNGSNLHSVEQIRRSLMKKRRRCWTNLL